VPQDIGQCVFYTVRVLASEELRVYSVEDGNAHNCGAEKSHLSLPIRGRKSISAHQDTGTQFLIPFVMQAKRGPGAWGSVRGRRIVTQAILSTHREHRKGRASQPASRTTAPGQNWHERSNYWPRLVGTKAGSFTNQRQRGKEAKHQRSLMETTRGHSPQMAASFSQLVGS